MRCGCKLWIRSLLWGACAGRAKSGEVQRALLVEPDVANQENPEKNKHREQGKSGKVLYDPGTEKDRPGKQKDGFHVENHKKHGDDVKARGVAPASRAFRDDAAFIGLQFCWSTARAGANVLEDD